MSRPTWVVRAGEAGFLVDDFRSQSVVAIGWARLGDLSTMGDREQIKARLKETHPEDRPGKVALDAGQVSRFLFEFEEGDRVITYDPQVREYFLGRIAGPYEYRPGFIGPPDNSYQHIRQVKWEGTVARDSLSPAAKNEIGAIMALFKLSDATAQEFEDRLAGRQPETAEAPATAEPGVELETIREDTIERAHEFIKDRISQLDWDQMQELVAGVLRAMGYKTRVSPRGADRGRDVIASPDGLGLEQPRIIVEVKHRRNEQMSADMIRAFSGGLRSGDRGLYVSTGGFSKEAKYEADRATVPITLITLDDLAQLVVQNYEAMDPDARSLIPLVRVYWPAS